MQLMGCTVDTALGALNGDSNLFPCQIGSWDNIYSTFSSSVTEPTRNIFLFQASIFGCCRSACSYLRNSRWMSIYIISILAVNRTDAF